MEAGFDNAAKRLHPYLRALWGRELRLHPYDRPLQQQRPYLSELGIHLPPSWHAGQGGQAFTLYRAAAAHLNEAQKRIEARVPDLDWAHRPAEQIAPSTFRWT